MRKDYDDVMARMKNANKYDLKAFYHTINRTVDGLPEFYASLSKADRSKYLDLMRKKVAEMWAQDYLPEVLGTGITLLNIESRFVPGPDAAYVREETDRIIGEARKAFENWRSADSI